MCSRWWHQGRNAIDQRQWREVQLVHLGATLVSARLTVLLGAALHQGGAVVCLDADTGIDREAAVLVGQHVFGINTLDQARPTKARRMHRRKVACTWVTPAASIALAGWNITPGGEP